jgi:Protein of unknown function (DUF1579)
MITRLLTESVRILCLAAPVALAACATTTHEDVGPDSHSATSSQAGKAQGDMPQMKLPPGWTEADMKTLMAAMTPGPMQQKMSRGVGHWAGKFTQWMAPDTEPMTTPCTCTLTSVMEGRFVKNEFACDMPGMGPFQGLGFYGYDNVAQKPVATWLDSMATGIMNGDGTFSSDGNTLTWNYHTMCPLTKKAEIMREVEKYTSDNSMTIDMYGNDPKSGKEFHMMHIDLTRQSS